MNREPLAFVAVLLLAGSACAQRSSAVSDASELQPADAVTIYVTNRIGPVEVLAIAGPTSYPMGYIDQGARKRFVLRLGSRSGRGVEFVARPRGAGTPAPTQGATPCTCGSSARPTPSLTLRDARSGELTLTPGDIVDWEIREGSSRATLRPR